MQFCYELMRDIKIHILGDLLFTDPLSQSDEGGDNETLESGEYVCKLNKSLQEISGNLIILY